MDNTLIKLSFWKAGALSRESNSPDCWAGTNTPHGSSLCLSSYLPFSLSVRDSVIGALVCDIKVASDLSRHFSQYSQCPSCHFFLDRNSFALLTFILSMTSLINWPAVCLLSTYQWWVGDLLQDIWQNIIKLLLFFYYLNIILLFRWRVKHTHLKHMMCIRCVCVCECALSSISVQILALNLH